MQSFVRWGGLSVLQPTAIFSASLPKATQSGILLHAGARLANKKVGMTRIAHEEILLEETEGRKATMAHSTQER